MPVVKVPDLRNGLNHYLRLVQRVESVLVSDRNRVIARIDPAGDAAGPETDDSRWLDDLERRGIVRRRGGKLPGGWIGRRAKVKADVVGALLEERQEGR